MSSTEQREESVNWYIDRTPDTHILNDGVRGYSFTFMEEPDENYYYSTIINQLIIRELTGGDVAYRDRDDEFIPFNASNRPETPSINFIVDEFILSSEELNCCICMEEQEDQRVCQLNCQHTFCIDCIDKHLERNYTCPLCRERISQIKTQTMEAIHEIHHQHH